MIPLPDGLVAIVKKDCPTCRLVEPVLRAIGPAAVCTQDDPGYPAGMQNVIDDTRLECSYRLNVDTVPTLVRMKNGREVSRVVGWERDEWRRFTGISTLGAELPPFQPGCGALNAMPGMRERLMLRFGDLQFASRLIEVPEEEDPLEVAYDRGWTDGLPVALPTDLRIARMLSGTTREPGEVVGLVPPNFAPCSVEKAAINAVMAGCRPEYFPVVLATLEAALEPLFSMHGLLCTTYFSGPLVIVNGPISRRIGMNSGVNALGQGNRANASIGRSLQLIVRNVGGGLPGGIDRATLGNPGKYTFCFAEDESDPEWVPLATARGLAPGANAVTLFHADGVTGLCDQKSRSPEELTRSLALGLFGVTHPKLCRWGNAVLVLSPDHYTIFRNAGWNRARIETELLEALMRPGRDLVIGAQGIGEGIDPALAGERVPKFHDGGLLIARAGGKAGLFSAIIGGWTGGRLKDEVRPVTKEIRT
jgi:hypothetical protein